MSRPGYDHSLKTVDDNDGILRCKLTCIQGYGPVYQRERRLSYLLRIDGPALCCRMGIINVSSNSSN